MRLQPLALALCIALAGCATTSPGYGNSGYNSGYSNASCYNCGTVQSIENVGRTPNATGAVLGGIVGAAATREAVENHTDSSAKANGASTAKVLLPTRATVSWACTALRMRRAASRSSRSPAAWPRVSLIFLK